MKTLVVSQSSVRCGYAVLEDGRLTRHGTLKANHKNPVSRLMALWESLKGLVEIVKPHEMVVKDVQGLAQKNQQVVEALHSILFICKSVAWEYGIPFYTQKPATIKKNLTGLVKVDKMAVWRSVEKQYGMPISAIEDNAQAEALAAAISWQLQNK